MLCLANPHVSFIQPNLGNQSVSINEAALTNPQIKTNRQISQINHISQTVTFKNMFKF